MVKEIEVSFPSGLSEKKSDEEITATTELQGSSRKKLKMFCPWFCFALARRSLSQENQ